jgi:ribonuclease P protein component
LSTSKTGFLGQGRGSFRFRRQERLKGRNEIRELFKSGRQYSCRGAKLFVLKNDLPNNRICFAFTRGFGNAVQRNRAKRLVREAYRLLLPRFAAKNADGRDLILLIYSETGAADLAAKVHSNTLSVRMEQMEFLFKKAGML